MRHRQLTNKGASFLISAFSSSYLFNVNLNLASHLQSLTHADFMALIRSVYTSLLNCVEGLQIENKIFLEVLEALQFVVSCSSSQLCWTFAFLDPKIPLSTYLLCRKICSIYCLPLPNYPIHVRQLWLAYAQNNILLFLWPTSWIFSMILGTSYLSVKSFVGGWSLGSEEWWSAK